MTLDTGQVVDNRYRIVKLRGQGGMGAVYRAWDMRLNRAIALKEMIPQLGLDASMLGDLREQFRQEAQVLATLVHPNLVRVTDYFSWDGNEYLVMDFVEGEDLAGRIAREGAQGEGRVLGWAGQLLDALAYCHKQGVIHRDIKPQNIIITPEGQAVLVDFGLVKLWDPSDPQTRTVMRGAGTPEYAPPEQYDMGVGHTDQRSDVYSVGATLYHALTGRLPPTATQRMASPASFVTPRGVNEAVSANTERVVLKALEMAMGQRYQSAEEMARALGIVPRSTVVVVPSGAKPRGKEPAREPKEAASAGRGILWGMGGAGLTVVIVLCLAAAVAAVLIGLNVFGGGEEPTATPTLTATSLLPTDTLPSPTDTPFPPTDTPFAPTATSMPTHTPEPLGGLLFEDNFSDPESGWEEWEREEGRAGYGEGYYYVIGVAEDIQVFGEGPQDFSDLVIDVYATQISAAPANINAYGVMCRVQADGDGYLLRVSGDGEYAIQRVVDGSFEFLVDWTESGAINQGNATNHLHVVCDGTRLALVANGEVLAETEDDTFTEGGIALTATTFESEPTEVHFDDLLVLDPALILLQDGFSDPDSGWEVSEEEGGSMGYREGVYFVRAEDKAFYYWGQAYVSFADVAIEVDATQVLGPANNNNFYGLGCRFQSSGEGYMFLISGDGYFAVYKKGPTEGVFLVEWTKSDVIRQGNATNHIRAICDGTYLALVVNGELLAEAEDAAYDSGDLALTVSTVEDDPTEVHFDDLLVYVP
ncbi:MAG: serine/threonine protein kinase [Anaerolineae bacterium]|nr:serine/threonine protein kinase [Anaerolineae bacterium]